MATPIDNYQESLAMTEWVPLQGIFPAREGVGVGYTPLGAILTFAGNFGPGGGPDADGQLLSIARNMALFSLFGTTYGGDGRTTFALPDMQAHTAIGAGQGPGLTDHVLGETAGTAGVDLTEAGLPRRLGGASAPFDNLEPSQPTTMLIRTSGTVPSETSGGGVTFIGEIVKFAGNFVPVGFMAAAGQLLTIADHQDLFDLIGTTYGGDGVTTFALPDLRGRNVVGASADTPVGTILGTPSVVVTNDALPTEMGGRGEAFDNQGPGVAMTYMIAVQGLFPTRDGNGGSAPFDEPYLGQIAIFAGDFAPRGWVKAEGQILSIAQNQALFSLLGTMYGGDGRTTFALPDLRDRTVIGADGDVPVGTVLGENQGHVLADAIPDLDLAGTASAEYLYGGGGDDRLRGLGGNDILIGNGGKDVLDGGAGADTMRGGAGDDVYYVDEAGDKVVEAAGAGTDKVYTTVSFTLAAGQEIEVLAVRSASTTTPLALIGNGFAQAITGNAGDNVLDGGGGADDMRGLGGNDTYYVDNAGDVVREAAGGGTDIVYTTVSYALAAGQAIETLAAKVATSTSALALTGNALAQTLIGNAGANVLDGGGGADTMRGLGGNDIYYVDNAGDAIEEVAGGGTDTVYASVSYTLAAAAAVEVLAAKSPAATTALNLTGNGFAQTITGNAGANVLDGGAGADDLNGLGGNDTLVGGSGADRLTGGLGADKLTGGTNADTFIFTSAADSNQTSGRDQILDFSAAQGDKISLAAIDARTDVAGDQAFTFIGSAAFSHRSGELRFAAVNGNVYVYGDIDGDGKADISVQVNGIAAIQASDFVL